MLLNGFSLPLLLCQLLLLPQESFDLAYWVYSRVLGRHSHSGIFHSIFNCFLELFTYNINIWVFFFFWNLLASSPGLSWHLWSLLLFEMLVWHFIHFSVFEFSHWVGSFLGSMLPCFQFPSLPLTGGHNKMALSFHDIALLSLYML